MLNLRHYNQSSVEFLTSIIRSKRNSQKDPTYKQRLQAMENALTAHFTMFDNSFDTNNLQHLVASGYNNQDKNDLLALYSYGNAIMQKLKAGISTTHLNRVVSTCQYCTIGEVNSFDHSVPQGEFPEYVVHPKNLFPSCSKCNSFKSSAWRREGQRLFLNLYLHQLPNIQYIFVQLHIRQGDLSASFEVSNIGGIHNDLYRKIEHHYHNLHLCERFAENIDKVVIPLKHSISSSIGALPMDQIVQIALQKSNMDRSAFGFNYWKSILEIQLLNSPDFLRLCQDDAL